MEENEFEIFQISFPRYLSLEDIGNLKSGEKVKIYDPFLKGAVYAVFIKLTKDSIIIKLPYLGKVLKRPVSKYGDNYVFML